MRSWLSFLAILAWQFLPTPSHAATPREELLRLVPDDTAICLVVQGLRDRAKTVGESPLKDWIKEKYQPLIGEAPEMEKLKNLELLFSSFIGVTFSELRDDIFGDVIVLAYQPGTPEKPTTEQGFILVKARDSKKLAKLVDKLNGLQKSAGELSEVKELTHVGQTYHKREKANGDGEFYLLKDDLFAFAAHESAIKGLIDRQKAAIASNAVMQSIDKLGVQNSFLFCWFNPRKLDRDVQAHVKAAPNEREKATRQQFAQIWTALDNFAIYLDANKDLELGIATNYRAEALPPEVKALVSKKPQPSALWQVIPDDALFAIAGRVSGSEMIDVVLSFAPAGDRAKIRAELEKGIGAVVGKDKYAGFMNGIGPDYGVWAANTKSDTAMANITGAVRINDPAVEPSVFKFVNFYTQYHQVEYNRRHDDQYESQTEDGITSFTNDKQFPKGLRPAFGLREGHFVFGSTPDRVKEFRKPTKESSNAAEVPFLRISGAAAHGYLKAHGPEFAKMFAESNNRPVDEVRKELETISEAIQVLHRAELFLRVETNATRVAMRFQFVKPLARTP